MGETKKKKRELERYIESIAYKYNPDTFHPINCTANHFSRDLLLFLVNKDLPQFLADSVRATERGFWARVFGCWFSCVKSSVSDDDVTSSSSSD